MPRTTAAILALTLAYAIIRYNVFGGVDLVQIPVYITNKAVSWSAVIFLALAAWHYQKQQKEASRWWGRASMHCVFLHLLLSLAVFMQPYYPKFFGPERLSLEGELLLLFGVLGTYGYWGLLRYDGRDPRDRLLLKLMASLFVFLHLFFMGYHGWPKFREWHGYLPPISLLSALSVLIAGAFYLRAGWKARKDQSSGRER